MTSFKILNNKNNNNANFKHKFNHFQVIEMLTQDFSKRGQALFFYNLKPSVVAVFEGVQPKDFITYYHKHDIDQLFQKWRLVYIYYT